MNRHVFYTELKRGLNWKIFAAAAAVAFCICFDSWNSLIHDLRSGGGSVHYYFSNSAVGGVCRQYLLPIFTTLPFSVSFCREYHDNLLPFIVSREGKKRYCIVKYLVNAICGGLAAGLGIAALFGFLALNMPMAEANDPSYMTAAIGDIFHAWLVWRRPFLYGAVEITNGFLTGVLWSCTALCVSAFIPNPFVVTVSPYLFSFAMVHTYRLLGVDNRYRLDKWLTGYSVIGSSGYTLLLSAITIAGIVILLGAVFVKRAGRRMENEGYC